MKETKSISRRDILRTSLAVAGSSALGPFVISTARAQSAEHKMLFAHTFTQASERYVITGLDLFKQLAEKYSEGRLLVDIHEGGKLGGQTELPQKVQYGAIQACQVSMQNFTPYSEVFNLLDLPFMFRTNEGFNKFLEHPDFANSKFMTDPERKGLKVLKGMWANTGFRVLCVSKRAGKQIRLPVDISGLKLRVTNSKIEQQTFALTPASPVSINWAETYQAMQQGAVDALNVGLGPLTANRIHEVIGTSARVDMSFNAHVTMISKKWYEKLPSSIQDAVERAAQESWDYQKSQQKTADEQMWSEWKAAGIEIAELSDDDRSQWIEAVGHQRPEWDSWKDRYGRQLYEQVAELGKSLST